ncbi:hypothetical protein [Erythrobacter oryzae]|uniref:hypothetical protein n=1 Tax=Erythrobacter oryzae TaxID=3019556 RepID=UPI0025567F2C|nr:hypothetical protein [Erythrobacter sp. COR-2]
MELLADGPAALGAIMLSVAIGSWSLGRWQSGARVSDAPAPGAPAVGGEAGEAPMPRAPLRTVAAAPCQDDARAERRTALAVADSLGELHAEISAYRRAQQVLAGPDADRLGRHAQLADVRSECRYLGLMGEPTCGLAGPVRGACTLGTRCSNADPLPPGPARTERLCQPSASGLTRV